MMDKKEKGGFISFKWMRPRRFGWLWSSDTRVLLVGLYFFAVGLDFGMRRSAWYRHFFGRRCPACGKALLPHDRNMRYFFHGECRTEGRKITHEEEKEKRRTPYAVKKMPWYKFLRFDHASA